MSAIISGLAMTSVASAAGSMPLGYEMSAMSRFALPPRSVQMPWVVTPDAL
jgi:hypothetical protein